MDIETFMFSHRYWSKENKQVQSLFCVFIVLFVSMSSVVFVLKYFINSIIDLNCALCSLMLSLLSVCFLFVVLGLFFQNYTHCCFIGFHSARSITLFPSPLSPYNQSQCLEIYGFLLHAAAVGLFLLVLDHCRPIWVKQRL